MKSFEEFQEALSMKDLKQIKGGTDAQRKIAQDRQKAREAKDKGFNKKPDLRKSQLGKWSEGIKKAPKKALPPAKDSSAIVKRPSSAVEKIAKGALAKVADTAAEKEHRQKSASGSAGEPKKDTTYRSGPKTEPAAPKGNTPKDKNKKNKKKGNFLSKAISKVGARAKAGAMRELERGGSEGTGVSTSGDLEGLSGRNKGLIG